MLGRGLDEKRWHVHLSDGGHFENLGLYELIRRRCRYIIVSDAGADPKWKFGDLGRAIEMARVDFGARVDLDTRPLMPPGKNEASPLPFVLGKVTYNNGAFADLIYIKTAITKGLPEDVYAYCRVNPSFPDETTIDQFFDERQFEAYRELGFQIGLQLCGKKDCGDLDALIKRLKSDQVIGTRS
ncbi:MAG: hypothetical protein GY849_06215 [Deltaproteobacteria bacterium]|nr:hypothetical protein [Deltaproteobacteria bacterium]